MGGADSPAPVTEPAITAGGKMRALDVWPADATMDARHGVFVDRKSGRYLALSGPPVEGNDFSNLFVIELGQCRPDALAICAVLAAVELIFGRCRPAQMSRVYTPLMTSAARMRRLVFWRRSGAVYMLADMPRHPPLAPLEVALSIATPIPREWPKETVVPGVWENDLVQKFLRWVHSHAALQCFMDARSEVERTGIELACAETLAEQNLRPVGLANGLQIFAACLCEVETLPRNGANTPFLSNDN